MSGGNVVVNTRIDKYKFESMNGSGISQKYDVLSRALANYKGGDSVQDKMAWFGGYELAMAVGGMLKAAELYIV